MNLIIMVVGILIIFAIVGVLLWAFNQTILGIAVLLWLLHFLGGGTVWRFP